MQRRSYRPATHDHSWDRRRGAFVWCRVGEYDRPRVASSGPCNRFSLVNISWLRLFFFFFFCWGRNGSRGHSRPGEAFVADVTYIWLLTGIYGELAGSIDSIVYMKRTNGFEHVGLGGRLDCIFFRRNHTGNSRRAVRQGSWGERCREWGAGSQSPWRSFMNRLKHST